MRISTNFASVLIMSGCLFGVAAPTIAFAQNQPANTGPARITRPIDEADMKPLKGNTHPLAQARFDRGPVAESTPTGHIMLVLQRGATQDAALKEYLASLQNPSSSYYHRWLTPAQFGASFGVSDSDVTTIEQWLQGHGFKIEGVPQGRNIIQFSGTVGQLENAFHTPIHIYEINGERHFANVRDPEIPATLAPVVLGVTHLNDFHPKSLSKPGAVGTYDASTRSIKPQFTLFNGTTPYLYVDPADAATIYNTPNAQLNPNYSGTTYDGAGVNIGIVGDSNVSLSDITNYRVAFLGETAATANIPTIVIDGNDPGINGDEPEGLLDNEIAGGLAPKAKIYFYTSANTDFQAGLFDAIFRAIDDNDVSILNISFGECEADAGTAANAAILEADEQAAAQGISVVVSSGDSGSAGCDSSASEAAQYGLAVNALASTPYNVAVGGTDFDVLPSAFATYAVDTNSGSAPYYRTALSYIPESPWNDSTSVNTSITDNQALIIQGSTNVIAAGGGASTVYAKPSFQTGLTPQDSVRDVPDVALLAANGLYGATWVVCADSAIYGPDCLTNNGQFVSGARFSGYGGTSTAAPAFSGILALVEQKTGSRLGQPNYILYQLANAKYASVFHDVTTGDNSVYCIGGAKDCNGNNFMTGFNAAVGYDQASGLGSVNAASMIADWNTVALTTTTTTFNINGSAAPIKTTHGTDLTFQIGVTPSTATGVAAIMDTANEISGGVQNNGQVPINIVNGSGNAKYNGLPGGSYTVYARYGGDATDAASASTPGIPVVIEPETSSTALKVSAYSIATGTTAAGGLSAVPYGSEIFFDAQVYGAAEGVSNSLGLATGSITFLDNGTTIGAAPISASSTASFPAVSSSSLPVYAIGAHSIVTKYAGDPSYSANTSSPVAFTVVKTGSTIAGSLSSASIPSAASTTLTVTVGSSSVGAAPTGTVTLTLNGAAIGTYSSLVSVGGYPAASQVKIVLEGSLFAAGSNTISLSYSGDANYNSSTGSVVLNVSPSKFTLKNSGALTFVAGAGTGNTATIEASPTNNFTGVINLSCSVTSQPAAAVSPVTCTVPTTLNIAGSSAVTGTLAAVSTTSTSAGSYTIKVAGTDAATGKISASTTVNVTVTAASNPNFGLTNSGNITIAPGATSGDTATVTVTPSGGFAGTVSLSCAVTTSVSNAQDLPTCSIPSGISITGASAGSATLIVSTTAASAALTQPFSKRFGATGGAFAAVAVFFCIPIRRRRWRHLMALLCVMTFGAAVGCGGSSKTGTTSQSNPGTTAGAYVVTVTGTSAGLAAQTTQVAVTVN